MALARQTLAHDWDGVTRPAAASPGLACACPVDLTIVDTRAGFDALEADWNALFERTGQSTHVFQTFNWNWHWANHFLNDGRTLAIVAGRRDGVLVMVWPLAIERVNGVKVLTWMGEPVSQYGDILAEPGPACMPMLRDAWAHIAATLKPDLVRLNKTRADATIAPLLAEMRALSTQQLEAPYLDLASAPTWAAYEERYSTKTRKNRRRLYRRLEEHGAVAIRQLPAGPQAAQIAALAIAMKRDWLAGKGLVSPALADARTQRFFEAVALDGSHPAVTRVSVLTCGNATAAVEIAFACRDRLAIHIMAYDLAFEKSAAGVLLLERLLQDSLEAGVSTYDLMAPGDSYKKDWADGAIRVDDFAVPVTGKGRFYAHAYLGWLRPTLKAALTRVGRLVSRMRG